MDSDKNSTALDKVADWAIKVSRALENSNITTIKVAKTLEFIENERQNYDEVITVEDFNEFVFVNFAAQQELSDSEKEGYKDDFSWALLIGAAGITDELQRETELYKMQVIIDHINDGFFT